MATDLPLLEPALPAARGEYHNHLIVPYTLDTCQRHAFFASPQGFNTGDHFFSLLKRCFRRAYAEGSDSPKNASRLGLHCRVIGRLWQVFPVGCHAFSRLHQEAHDRVWVTARIGP